MSSSSITFTCPTCSTPYTVGPERAGCRARCRVCKELVVVAVPLLPEPSPPPPSPAQAPSPVTRARTPTGPAPATRGGQFITGAVLVGIAVVVAVVLLVRQHQERERELQQTRIDNSLGSFRANMGLPTK
jgi:hypothetical protein